MHERMMPDMDFQVRSLLAAPADAVWNQSFRMDVVNEELRPWMRMTYPKDKELLDSTPVGRRAFRSIIMLGRVLPADYYDVTFVDIEPGRCFRECSSSLFMRQWEHQRVLEPLDGGCAVVDSVHYQARLPGFGRLLRPLFVRLFKSRHRVMRQRFGVLSQR